MSPESFFAPYQPPGGQPYSYHLHSAVRPPPNLPNELPEASTRPAEVPQQSTQSPSYRPGRPYPYIPPDTRSEKHESLGGGPPHTGPPRPHRPPPFSPPEDGPVPMYTASSPPPAYSPHSHSKTEKCQCQQSDSYEGEEGEEGADTPRDRVRQVVMLILIALNVAVWGVVLYTWVQDDMASRLLAELQAEGSTRFQI